MRILGKLPICLLVAAAGIGLSPVRVMRLDLGVERAEARGGGGMRGGPPRGAKLGGGGRPARMDRVGPRPSIGGNRARGFAGSRDRPITGPRPARLLAGQGPGRPGIGDRPGRPGGGYRPGRPGARPPGYRPPHSRPRYSRPAGWRPRYHRPPYYRRPHWRWGNYDYTPAFGWFFTATVAGATLAYVAELPTGKSCDEVLYECSGVLYCPAMHQEERVYEIVSSEEDVSEAPGSTGVPAQPSSTQARRVAVLELQRALVARGCNPGGTDGVLGPGTGRALRAFQLDRGLPATGALDQETARLLGL